MLPALMCSLAKKRGSSDACPMVSNGRVCAVDFSPSRLALSGGMVEKLSSQPRPFACMAHSTIRSRDKEMPDTGACPVLALISWCGMKLKNLPDSHGSAGLAIVVSTIEVSTSSDPS